MHACGGIALHAPCVLLTRNVPPSISAPRQFSTNLLTAALASGNASGTLRRAGTTVVGLRNPFWG
eukprot:352483-Chlamydomonas_euryale.AAC.9